MEHAARGQLLGPFRGFPSTEDGIAVQKMALDVAFFLHRQNGRHISRTQMRKPTTAPQELLYTSVDSVVLGTVHEPYWSTLKSLSWQGWIEQTGGDKSTDMDTSDCMALPIISMFDKVITDIRHVQYQWWDRCLAGHTWARWAESDDASFHVHPIQSDLQHSWR